MALTHCNTAGNSSFKHGFGFVVDFVGASQHRSRMRVPEGPAYVHAIRSSRDLE
jgi:hypothetical protein